MPKELQFCNFCLYAIIHDFSYVQRLVAVLVFVLLLGTGIFLTSAKSNI